VVLAPTPLFPPSGAAPCVVVVHDAVPWTHPQTLTPRGVAWHRAQVERATREAALVVVPTLAVAGELRRHVRLREVLVVGEGVSADLALPADASARAQRLDLPARYLLTVATLEPRKGLDVLLEALARPEAPDLPLLCVGQPGGAGWTSSRCPQRCPPAGSGHWGASRTRTWRSCWTGRPRWSCRAGPRDSGCRCSRPWPRAPPS
jgi:glycosyltransferase involved in cell wall biosynthesis